MRTFEVHPALSLPLRPAHVKSAMRLRPSPTHLSPRPAALEDERCTRAQECSEASRDLVSRRHQGVREAGSVLVDQGERRTKHGDEDTGERRGTTRRDVGGDDLDRDGVRACCHGCDLCVACTRVCSALPQPSRPEEQHLAWFLLTSACLSKVRKWWSGEG